MGRSKPAWHVIVPSGISPAACSRDEVRAAKWAHGFLTEELPGSEAIACYIRAFRYLLFFGIACVAEDRG